MPVTVNPPAPISVTLNYTLSGTPQVLSLTPTAVQSALGPVTYYWNTSWGLTGVAAAPPWNFSGLPAGPAWASVTVVDASGRSASSNVVAVMIGNGTTPSYSLDAPTGPNGSFIVAQGGSTNAYIILSSFNGYMGAPALSLGTLPAGINVSFSDGGIETYGVVTATISASASTIVPGGHYTIPIYSTDGTYSYNSLALPVVVQGAPLSVKAKVAYTNLAPTAPVNGVVQYVGTFTKLTLGVTGGTAPFTYTVSNGMAMTTSATQPQVAMGTMAAQAGDTPLTVTVTDSGSPLQVVTQTITVHAPHPLPDQYLHMAMLGRVNALNAFAAQLPDQGAAVIAAFETAAGITQAQFGAPTQPGTLSAVAAAYQTALTSSHVNYNNLRAGYSKSAESVPASAALQTLIQTQAALPAAYFSQVQSALGQAFGSLDSYAGQYFSSMDYCYGGAAGDGNTYDGCDPYDGFDAGPSWDVFYTHWVSLDLDPKTGRMWGQSNVNIWGVVYNDLPYEWTISDPVLNVSITGPPGTSPGGNLLTQDCGAGCATASISFAQATAAGIYSMNTEAIATASIDGVGFGIDDFVSMQAFWNNNCVGPQITSISVYANGSQLPQPTNALTVPSSGFMYIQGACLDATTTATVDGNGVTVGVWVVPDSGESTVEVTYTVAANAQVGPQSLYLTTDAGYTNATINVVQSGPYISSVVPSVWPAGQQTSVTITGTGFGTNQPASNGLVINSQHSVSISYSSWSDGQIVVTLTPDSNDPGENVTVSVTAGQYGNGFAPNPDQGQSTQTPARVAPAGQPGLSVTCTGSSAVCPNGSNVAANSTVFISGQPAFPPLVASLTPAPGQTLSGNVQWQFTAIYNSPPDPKTGYYYTFTCTAPASGTRTLAATASWNIASEGTGICGGTATVSYTYGNYYGSLTFNIFGLNPSVSIVQAQLNGFSWNPSAPWYLFQLVNHESNYLQFNLPGRTRQYLPNYGPPQGFGVMQVDPPVSDAQIWDWTQNVAAGEGILQADITNANNFWQIQVQNYVAYNNGFYSKGILPSPALPTPENQPEGPCVFGYTPTPANGEHPFSDALALKYYNAPAVRYIQFILPTSETSFDASWSIVPQGNNGTDYPALVCSTSPQP